MKESDIHFVYSGNGTAEGSLGGPMTDKPVTSLFDTLTPQQSRLGYYDYRCIYVINEDRTEAWRDLLMWIDSEKSSGSFLDIGLDCVDEVQTISFRGEPGGGAHMRISVPNFPPDITVPIDPDHPDPTAWAIRFQELLRENEGLTTSTVSASGHPPEGVTFVLTFRNDAGSRSINQVMVEDMLGGTTKGITVARKVRGSPIGVIAPKIAKKTIAPPNVNFDYPLVGNPKYLGTLKPMESFPIWIRRVTPRNTVAFKEDFIKLMFSGVYP